MELNHPLLNIKEAAQLLRSELPVITKLLKSGELQGFQVENEWRIPMVSITNYVTKQLESQCLQTTLEFIKDSKAWAKLIRQNYPSLEADLRNKEYEKGSVGEFFNQGLDELDAEQTDDDTR